MLSLAPDVGLSEAGYFCIGAMKTIISKVAMITISPTLIVCVISGNGGIRKAAYRLVWFSTV